MSRQRDYIWVASTPRDRRRQIIVEVADKHGVEPDQLVQPCREHRISHARFEAMAVMRREFGDSYPRIGRFFGGMDHSSVMRGIRRFHEMEAR